MASQSDCFIKLPTTAVILAGKIKLFNHKKSDFLNHAAAL
jgi:hypothetical protein